MDWRMVRQRSRMIDYIRIPLSVLVACMMLGVARADEPGITTLLARAHAEAAAGQLLAPAGDNVLETLMYLKDWVSFTLEQLNEIQTLLDEVLQEEKKNAVKADRPPSAEITLRESYDS